MNISYKWLQHRLPSSEDPQKTAERLTSIGLEVGSIEEIESIPGGLKGLVIGRVLTCDPHPDSDHLSVTTVDVGQGSPLQIVCGAPNVAADRCVVAATIGTVLGQGSDKPFTIKKSKLRGVESCGMLCSEAEIGVGSASEGIILLPQDAASPGMPAADYYKLESDYRIEVDITPNRVDATSHFGVARDLAASITLEQGRLVRARMPHIPDLQFTDAEAYPVRREAGEELCPRFELLRINGVRVAESPGWLKEALVSIGQKPINNIVDITNYVLHDLGQPLHAYDAARVTDGIVVRLGNEGESLTTLDGIVRDVTVEDIVIADESGRPLGLAGVMGGLHSSVSSETTDILLESANFNPSYVRRTARRNKLNTDASFRFERGTDANCTDTALRYAAALIIEIAGGEALGSITDLYPVFLEPFRVSISPDRLERIIGIRIPDETIALILESLEIKVAENKGSTLLLEVPRYRIDVCREVDIAEEVLRIYGYNRIPLSGRMTVSVTEESEEDRQDKLRQTLSDLLCGAGFREIMNNSLTASEYCRLSETYPAARSVTLLNPLSRDLDTMRQTMLFGGLETIVHNAGRQASRFYLYEWGKTYARTGEVSSENPLNSLVEREMLGIWVGGKRVTGSWAHPEEISSVFEVKARVYSVLQRMGVTTDMIDCRKSENDLYAAAMDIYSRKGIYMGVFGVVSSRILKAFDIDTPVYFAELDYHAIYEQGQRRVSGKELSKFPEVRRDLALLIDKSVAYAQIEKSAMQAERKYLRRMELFDVYEGKNMAPEKKSYAVAFYLRDDEKTMNDKQIDSVMQKIYRALESQIGATLR